MKRLAHSTLVAVLGLALMTGCGGDDDGPSEDESPTATESAPEETQEPTPLTDTNFGPPAAGDTITGTGYTFRVPRSWEDIAEAAAEFELSVDSAAGESDHTDDFQDNVAVTFDTVPAGTNLGDLEASVHGQLSASVEDLEIRPRVVVSGVEALHYRGLAEEAGVNYQLEEFVMLRETQVLVVTFSFSPELSESQRENRVNQVMASWTWRDEPEDETPADD